MNGEFVMLWNGFECIEFEFESYAAKVILPKNHTVRNAVAVKTTYFNAFPETEIMLLEKGMLLCFIACDGRWGKKSDIDRMARFIDFVAEKYGTAPKCVPVGMSCGGLMAVQLAAKYPEKVACLYLDAPVMNLMSCPYGFGIGVSESGNYAEICDDLDIKSVSELICYRDMPMHNIPALVEKQIPVVMVAGDSDEIVPYCENGVMLEKAYKESGVELEVHVKEGCNHHPHGLDDPLPVVEFIMKHI